MRRARTAWKEAELEPIGLHECRHTYAAFMIAAGVNAKALSTYMGHSSITVTLDRYGHLHAGQRRTRLPGCSPRTCRGTVGLITRRSRVRIPPPLPHGKPATAGFPRPHTGLRSEPTSNERVTNLLSDKEAGQLRVVERLADAVTCFGPIRSVALGASGISVGACVGHRACALAVPASRPASSMSGTTVRAPPKISVSQAAWF